MREQAPALLCPAIRVPEFEPCAASELEPLLRWIAADQRVDAPRSFPRGTALPDGRLDLCKQALGVDGALRVLGQIAGNRQIKSLLLGTDGLGDRGAEAAAALIREGRAPALETLYLGCNHISEAGAAALSDALARDDSPVRALWLKRNPLGPAGAARLAALLRRRSSLRVLDLTNSALTEAGAITIAEALRARPGLEVLLLGSNGVGPRGAAALAEQLAEDDHLRDLSLAVSRLGDAGAAALARGLAQNRGLERLDLRSCGIGPTGLAALLDACARHPTLTSLELGTTPATRVLGERDNDLRDAEGGALLGEYLRHDPSLRRLELVGAGLRSAGALRIEAGLAGQAMERDASTRGSTAVNTNRTLVECRLGRQVSRRVKRRIAALLERNREAGGAPPGVPEHVAAILSVYRSKREG